MLSGQLPQLNNAPIACDVIMGTPLGDATVYSNPGFAARWCEMLVNFSGIQPREMS